MILHKLSLPQKVRLYFEPRDIWIGVYWNYRNDYLFCPASSLDIYICLIPMIPIKLSWGWGLLHPKAGKQ